MLDFLKRLFSKASEAAGEESGAEHVNVKFDQIEEWIEDQTEQFFADVNGKAAEVLKSFKESKEDIEKELEKLRTAELRNKNIPMRAIQIMEGNRKAFISSNHRFLDKLDYDRLDYRNWTEFYSVFEQELEMVAKANKKSYMVLQEFFANESKDIAMKVKAIEDKIISANKSISGRDQAGFAILMKKVEDIRNKSEYIANNEKEIRGKRVELKKREEEHEQQAERLEELKNSEKYKDVKNLNLEKARLKEEIKKSQQGLLNTFGQFDRALKKYSKISIEPVLTLLYLKDPYKALMDDPNLKILNILSGLADAVEHDKLGLKDKQKEKTLSVIRELDGRFFNGIFEENKKLVDKIADIDKQTKSQSVMIDIDELSYNLTHLDEKIETMKKDITILERNSEKYDIDKLKEELKQDIREQLNIEAEFE